MPINLKRVYDRVGDSDGGRILVDRLWPRGISKESLHLDARIAEIAPSVRLRRWFDHNRMKWDEFKRRYFRELDARPEAVEKLLSRCQAGTVTLLFGARDRECNHAMALKEYLERRLQTREG